MEAASVRDVGIPEDQTAQNWGFQNPLAALAQSLLLLCFHHSTSQPSHSPASKDRSQGNRFHLPHGREGRGSDFRMALPSVHPLWPPLPLSVGWNP